MDFIYTPCLVVSWCSGPGTGLGWEWCVGVLASGSRATECSLALAARSCALGRPSSPVWAPSSWLCFSNPFLLFNFSHINRRFWSNNLVLKRHGKYWTRHSVYLERFRMAPSISDSLKLWLWLVLVLIYFSFNDYIFRQIQHALVSFFFPKS